MNPLQYINKIFCTLLFFSAGNKNYSQREIHPLEPMFTYDYALKYYSNLHIIGKVHDYCSIENFKAPDGVKTIESLYNYQYYPTSTGRMFTNIIDSKVLYHYNPDTGYLEQRLLLKISDKKKVIDTLGIDSYNYYFKEDVTIIEKETKRPDFNGGTIYTFENLTGLLTKSISSSTTFKDDNTESTYSNTNEYYYNTTNELNIRSINKIKLTTQTKAGKILQNEREYSVSIKKEATHPNVDWTVYPEGKNNNDIIELKMKGIGRVTISEKHIYYGLSGANRGLVLFDENKRPVEYRYYEDKEVLHRYYSSSFPYDWVYIVLSKKTDNRWHQDHFNRYKRNSYDYAKTSHSKFWIKDRITKEKRKGYTIYYDSYPALIYKYH